MEMAPSKSKYMTDKLTITTQSGQTVEALAPVIISASRSTDIPAFYAQRLVVGENQRLRPRKHRGAKHHQYYYYFIHLLTWVNWNLLRT